MSDADADTMRMFWYFLIERGFDTTEKYDDILTFLRGCDMHKDCNEGESIDPDNLIVYIMYVLEGIY